MRDFSAVRLRRTESDPVTFVLITRWESRAKLKAYLPPTTAEDGTLSTQSCLIDLQPLVRFQVSVAV